MEMNALFFPGSKTVEVAMVPVQEPSYGQVLVRIMASGICRSDLHFMYSVPKEKRNDPQDFGLVCPPEIISGHEPCGIVEKVGKGVKNLKVGSRVAVYHISGCGICIQCRNGWQIVCENKKETYGFDRNGSNADFMVADEKDCVIVPESVSFAIGAWSSCGSATAYGALKRLDVSGRDNLAVFGLGQVGLAAVFLARGMGVKEIFAVDLLQSRLDLAKDIGATITINPKDQDPVEVIREATARKGVTTAIECTASPVARNQALDAASLWGRVALVGIGNETTIDPTTQFIQKQLTVFGSWVFSLSNQQEMLNLIAKYDLPMDRLITNRYSLTDAERAMKDFDSGATTGKAIFEW